MTDPIAIPPRADVVRAITSQLKPGIDLLDLRVDFDADTPDVLWVCARLTDGKEQQVLSYWWNPASRTVTFNRLEFDARKGDGDASAWPEGSVAWPDRAHVMDREVPVTCSAVAYGRACPDEDEDEELGFVAWVEFENGETAAAFIDGGRWEVIA